MGGLKLYLPWKRTLAAGRFMIFKWLPWKYMVRRVARHHGFLDPLMIMSRLANFAQPSEVGEPIELLRAGLVFHARGLMNTGPSRITWIGSGPIGWSANSIPGIRPSSRAPFQSAISTCPTGIGPRSGSRLPIPAHRRSQRPGHPLLRRLVPGRVDPEGGRSLPAAVQIQVHRAILEAGGRRRSRWNPRSGKQACSCIRAWRRSARARPELPVGSERAIGLARLAGGFLAAL